MQNKTEGRRTQKTRKALNNALFSLMVEKNYESIAVQEILDRADIGRSTFYSHFRDKDALLVDGLQGLRELLHSAQKSASRNSMDSYEKVIGFSLAMFEHAHDHKDIYLSLVGGYGWTIVRQHIEEMIVQLMKKEARPLYKNSADSEIPFDLFIDFLGATFIAVMTWWSHYKKPISPKEINTLFRSLVIPTLSDNLRR
ncbi:MAG: TetR/AcrR family transcriptional regulator [Gammaproteobacteria bacterium]|nr:TetR/AcrR family transcriptional regulator [Gammaproteobacteria bacterium]